MSDFNKILYNTYNVRVYVFCAGVTYQMITFFPIALFKSHDIKNSTLPAISSKFFASET